ncbi:MAG: hypothetical protein SNG35_00830 [Rikenellaceae bacterium]
MKRFFRSFVLITVAAMSIVACSEGDGDESILEQSSGTTLTASVSSSAETKVSFTDKGTDGINLEWEEDDSFTLYDEDGVSVGDFTCSDADNGTFGNDEIYLNDGGNYTAIFPATTKTTLDEALEEDLTSIQNGNVISDLNNACMMKATFTYNADSDNTIKFSHLKANLTIVFDYGHFHLKIAGEDDDAALYCLKITIGTKTYEVNFDPSITDDATLYIMIDPDEDFDGTSERELVFIFYYYWGVERTSYTAMTIESDKVYKAGYRYTGDTAKLEDYLNMYE